MGWQQESECGQGEKLRCGEEPLGLQTVQLFPVPFSKGLHRGRSHSDEGLPDRRQDDREVLDEKLEYKGIEVRQRAADPALPAREHRPGVGEVLLWVARIWR